MSRSWETGLFVLALTWLAFAGLRVLLPFAAPFLVALMLAALLDQPTNWLQSLGIPRGVAVLILIGSSVLVSGASILLVGVNLVRDMGFLVERLPVLALRLQEVLAAVMRWLDGIATVLPPSMIADLPASLVAKLTQALELTALHMVAAVAALPNLIGGAVVCVLATFFLVRDGRQIAHAARSNLPPAWRQRTAAVNREIFARMVGLVRAQFLLMSGSTALTILSLLLFRVPYAWLLGTLSGLLDLLPIVGPSGVFVPLITWFWVTGCRTVGVGLAATWGMIILVRQAVEPSIVGSQVGLHPLTSLVAMYIGVRAYGLVGVLAAPLLATSLKAVWLGALRPLLYGGA